MGTKANPGNYDCYANALDDEPIFVLLARDPDFARLVNLWADRREADILCGARPEADRMMVIEARLNAMKASEWRFLNNGAWHKPREEKPASGTTSFECQANLIRDDLIQREETYERELRARLIDKRSNPITIAIEEGGKTKPE